MRSLGLLAGIPSRVVVTPRLKTHLLESGTPDGAPVIFVHGNVSSSRFWEETMAALPPRYRAIAPDLRGYGESEARPVDATRGVRDFSDDVHSLLETLGLIAAGSKVHLVGWSLGGCVVMQYTIDHPTQVASLVLVAPGSPYGFGATKDMAGTPCWPDYAGSGAGTANPEFVKRLAAGDRSEENDFSPRKVMNTFLFKPPFRAAPDREEVFVSALLSTRVADANYPGDFTPSDNWPYVAPGRSGVNNAVSPKYCNLSPLIEVSPKPPVLWIRGADDQIVSDNSLFDPGYLGQIGALPGWPGPDIFPPQPMVSQTRAVLDAYRQRGGQYREEVIPDCGHSPHIEKPETFRRLLLAFLAEHTY